MVRWTDGPGYSRPGFRSLDSLRSLGMTTLCHPERSAQRRPSVIPSGARSAESRDLHFNQFTHDLATSPAREARSVHRAHDTLDLPRVTLRVHDEDGEDVAEVEQLERQRHGGRRHA